ncbi:MAG: putative toxin-antitoxin system toxin component, PIN family [Erysipelotrichales bacterium]|nr:MAG: putative toxin-antitoxin system toxin component, PIN family [Erysipelotrichales bacterium]
MEIILDTNVIIAAFATRGLCSAVFELCLDRFEVILSEAILKETRQHLYGKIKLPYPQCNLIVSYLRESCIISETDDPNGSLCRDPKDLHVLGLAKRSTANYIITGDKDLLDFARFEETKIITPREFWALLKK